MPFHQNKKNYFLRPYPGKGQGYQESNTSGTVPGQAAALPETGGGQAAKGGEEEAGEGEDDERD